jgi:hypothetical protein
MGTGTAHSPVRWRSRDIGDGIHRIAAASIPLGNLYLAAQRITPISAGEDRDAR